MPTNHSDDPGLSVNYFVCYRWTKLGGTEAKSVCVFYLRDVWLLQNLTFFGGNMLVTIMKHIVRANQGDDDV